MVRKMRIRGCRERDGRSPRYSTSAPASVTPATATSSAGTIGSFAPTSAP